MEEFMGWSQTTSSDNLKQYLVIEDTTLDDGTVLNAGDILILVPSEDGDIFYKRNDHNAESDTNGFKITDVSILTELPKGKIPIFGKVINGVDYRFLKDHFIGIFKPLEPGEPDELSHDNRKNFMNSLELILKSYLQDMETGSFHLKSKVLDRDLPIMNQEEREQYRHIIMEILGKKLDYIHMVRHLVKISSGLYSELMGETTTAQMKPNDGKYKKNKRKQFKKRKQSKKRKHSKKRKQSKKK